jgi:hypothetical protein
MTRDSKDNIMTRWPLPTTEQMAEKNARNARVQARYDELMREGKHGHYETMFRVVREEVEAALSLAPLVQVRIRSEPVEVDLTAPIHTTLYVLHLDGSVSPAALRSSSTTAGADEVRWMPIETAPKHEEVLVWREDQGIFVAQLTTPEGVVPDEELHNFPDGFEEWWSEQWGWLESDLRPTRWMPFPAEPAIASQEQPK